MAVLLTDGRYTLHRQPTPQTRDGHGLPVPGPAAPPAGPGDGASSRQADGAWTLRLDPALWPVSAGDTVTRAADGHRWVVTGTPRLHEVPGHPDVDYVAVTAVQDPPDVDRGYPSRDTR